MAKNSTQKTSKKASRMKFDSRILPILFVLLLIDVGLLGIAVNTTHYIDENIICRPVVIGFVTETPTNRPRDSTGYSILYWGDKPVDKLTFYRRGIAYAGGHYEGTMISSQSYCFQVVDRVSHVSGFVFAVTAHEIPRQYLTAPDGTVVTLHISYDPNYPDHVRWLSETQPEIWYGSSLPPSYIVIMI